MFIQIGTISAAIMRRMFPHSEFNISAFAEIETVNGGAVSLTVLNMKFCETKNLLFLNQNADNSSLLYLIDFI